LRGLDYAHRKTTDNGTPLGIVHRDVSPSNILISFEGEVKVCDFGIAHANDAVASDAYSEDLIKGKAGYMSPEQALGKPLDARADVFAIGIVLWELLAGRKLYKATPDTPLLGQARAARIPELPSRGLPLEEELFAISRKALAPERDDRYPSAQAMLFDLERYVAQSMLIASPIRFGEWLSERFGEELIRQRRERERVVQMLEEGVSAEVLADRGHAPSGRRSVAVDDGDASGEVEARASSGLPAADLPFAHIVEEGGRAASRGWMALAGLVLLSAGGAVLYLFLAANR
jgi:serine/threonine protein kinase